MRTAAREWLPAGALTGDPVRRQSPKRGGMGRPGSRGPAARRRPATRGSVRAIAEDEAGGPMANGLPSRCPPHRRQKLVFGRWMRGPGRRRLTERGPGPARRFRAPHVGDLARGSNGARRQHRRGGSPRECRTGRAADAITVRVADGKGGGGQPLHPARAGDPLPQIARRGGQAPPGRLPGTLNAVRRPASTSRRGSARPSCRSPTCADWRRGTC